MRTTRPSFYRANLPPCQHAHSLTLVAYDITDDRCRARVLKAVQAFGLDGQKSVHETALSPAERIELEKRLRAALGEHSDRLLILRLDPRGTIRAIGGSKPARPPDYFYVG